MSPTSRSRRGRPRPGASTRTGRDDRTGPSRYTPPGRPIRFRSGREKTLGWFLVGLGIVVIIVNYVDYADLRLLPGGHNELYFFLGILIAGGGTWWLGLFDRSQ